MGELETPHLRHHSVADIRDRKGLFGHLVPVPARTGFDFILFLGALVRLDLNVSDTGGPHQFPGEMVLLGRGHEQQEIFPPPLCFL